MNESFSIFTNIIESRAGNQPKKAVWSADLGFLKKKSDCGIRILAVFLKVFH